MKKFVIICACALLSVLGYKITTTAVDADVGFVKQNTLAAANVLDWKIDRPNTVRYITDVVKPDTVVIEKHDTVQVEKVKYIKVRETKNTTQKDSPVVEDSMRVNKEHKVFLPDEQPISDPSSVILYVNGEKVYSTNKELAPVEQPDIFNNDEP